LKVSRTYSSCAHPTKIDNLFYSNYALVIAETKTIFSRQYFSEKDVLYQGVFECTFFDS